MSEACCAPAAAEETRPLLQKARVGIPWVLLLLPKAGCPLCWPLLAGLLGAFGVSLHALNTASIALIAAALVVFALRGILVRRKRREMAWLSLSSAAVLAYRLQGASTAIALLACALLFTAIVLWSRPRRRACPEACTVATH